MRGDWNPKLRSYFAYRSAFLLECLIMSFHLRSASSLKGRAWRDHPTTTPPSHHRYHLLSPQTRPDQNTHTHTHTHTHRANTVGCAPSRHSICLTYCQSIRCPCGFWCVMFAARCWFNSFVHAQIRVRVETMWVVAHSPSKLFVAVVSDASARMAVFASDNHGWRGRVRCSKCVHNFQGPTDR